MAGESSPAFFSYSRIDSEFALRLAEDLKAAGADVWIDQLDIECGQEFDVAIEQAVTRASRMLLILTPESVQSGKVRNEIAYALDEEKIVIPILCKDCVVPLQLRRVQYIDFRSDYERGLKALIKILRLQEAEQKGKPGTATTTSRGTYRPKRRIQTTGNGSALFPLYGITLGETTVEEMESMGFSQTDSIDDKTGEPYRSFKVKGLIVGYGLNDVVDSILFPPDKPFPKKWQELGFSWRKSYDGWLSLLSQMGYSIEVEEEPHAEEWVGADTFSAEVVARTQIPLPHQIRLSFMSLEGTSTSSPATLLTLTVRTP
jgi:hypothetical protein